MMDKRSRRLVFDGNKSVIKTRDNASVKDKYQMQPITVSKAKRWRCFYSYNKKLNVNG